MKNILTLIWYICKTTVTTIYYLPIAIVLFCVLDMWIMRSFPDDCPLRVRWDNFIYSLIDDSSNIRNEVNWHIFTVISAVVFYGTIYRLIMMLTGHVD